MKITSVDIYNLTPSIANKGIAPICIRVNTDEGISGFGEVGVGYGIANHAGVGIARDFSEIIIGMDPMKIEAIWEHIFRRKVTQWACTVTM
jgi:galactonate dehydratase